MSSKIPKDVLDAYDIGNIHSSKELTSGLTHQTFKLETSTGIFILQKMKSFPGIDAIGEDFLAVTRFLDQKQFPCPRAVLSVENKVLVYVDEEVWRMQTYIDGNTYHQILHPDMAREAGAFLGRFHRTMANIPHTFQTTMKWFETEKYVRRLNELLHDPKTNVLQDRCQEEIAFIQNKLPSYVPEQDIRTRVMHADPKISNFLFNDDGKVMALVDLDTVQPGDPALDLGDAFRSWCGVGEDDPKNLFQIEIFKAGMEGYLEEVKEFLSEEEINRIPQSIGRIILELATRFLIDYFEDSYFGWDESKYATRREHNLARVRGQIAEFIDFERQLSDIQNILKSNI